MSGARKQKTLHVAKNLDELHKTAEAKVAETASASAKQIISSLDKLQVAAYKALADGDDEIAYLLFYRFIEHFTSLRSKSDFKDQQEYVKKLFSKKKVEDIYGKCDQLSARLIERYDKEYPQFSKKALIEKFQIGKKISDKDSNSKAASEPKNGYRTDPVNNLVSSKVPASIEEVAEESSITLPVLKNLIEQKSTRFLVIDCRDFSSFTTSHLNHPNCISIPDVILVRGSSAQKISDRLKSLNNNDVHDYELWNQRETFDHIILYDWKTTLDSRDPDVAISVLYDALTMWDVDRKHKRKPQILQGGIREIFFKYPLFLTNPLVTGIERTSSAPSTFNNLDSIVYPKMEDDTVRSNKPPSQDPSSPRIMSNITNNNSTVGITDENVIPDRSTKPSKLPSKANENGVATVASPLKDTSEMEIQSINTPLPVNVDQPAVLPSRNTKPAFKFFTSKNERPNNENQNPSLKEPTKSNTVKDAVENFEAIAKSEANYRPSSSINVAVNGKIAQHQASSLDANAGNIRDGSQTINSMYGDISEKTRKGTIKRSQSIPNLKKLGDDDEMHSPSPTVKTEQTPIYQRSLKPQNNKSSTSEAYAGKRRDFQAVRSTQSAVTGLKNLGNTCYTNSIIQCLCSITELVEYFSNNTYRNDISYNGKTNGHTTEEFASVIREVNKGHRVISLNDFKAVTAGLIPNSRYGEQQDSHEFLLHLIGRLHDELNRVKGVTILPEQNNDGVSDETAGLLAWKNFKKLNDSILVDLFWGLQKSCVTCLSCGKQSVTFEAFSVLSIPIPARNSKRCDIKQCLDLYTSEEEVSFNCVQCKREVKSTKKIDLWRLPLYLIIQFQRFYSEGFLKKKVTEVDFPLDNLDLSTYIKGSRTNTQFELYGVSNHLGTMEGGHYTAYCRRSRHWYEFDDSVVKLLARKQDIVTQNGYIVFYHSK